MEVDERLTKPVSKVVYGMREGIKTEQPSAYSKEKGRSAINVQLRNALLGTIPQPPAALNEFSGNCPDGSYPLKHCTPTGCPPGYYCHYDLCCQHTKPGSCPWKLPNGVGAAGPPCDSDIDCSYNLKCCQINGRSRCVFPYGYSGGTVGVNTGGAAAGPVQQAPVMTTNAVAPAVVPVASPGIQYGYEVYGSPVIADPYMGGYIGGYGDFGMFPGYGGIYG
uniref:WAP domain-containing protein n=1 Tax=Trichuris muris TaxID=70415 RepID=A0A5S6QZN8_TRIMR